MPGIDPSIIVHKLNVSPSFSLVCQKKVGVCARTGQGHS